MRRSILHSPMPVAEGLVLEGLAGGIVWKRRRRWVGGAAVGAVRAVVDRVVLVAVVRVDVDRAVRVVLVGRVAVSLLSLRSLLPRRGRLRVRRAPVRRRLVGFTLSRLRRLRRGRDRIRRNSMAAPVGSVAGRVVLMVDRAEADPAVLAAAGRVERDGAAAVCRAVWAVGAMAC